MSIHVLFLIFDNIHLIFYFFPFQYLARINHYVHEACDFKLIQASTEERKKWWQTNTSDLGSPNFCHYTFFFHRNSCHASLLEAEKRNGSNQQ